MKNPDGIPLRLRERAAVEPELELTPDDHDDDLSALCQVQNCQIAAAFTMPINAITTTTIRTDYRIRVCAQHKADYSKIPRLQAVSKTIFRAIPYVVNRRTAKCLRCGARWEPDYWKVFGKPNYGKMPSKCSICKSRYWTERKKKKK